MKRKLLVMLILVLLVISFVNADETDAIGQIYLFGEQHGVKQILDRELEQWDDYYHNLGMRHLFIEYPSFMSEWLNRWMCSDNDAILDMFYEDLKGSAAYNPAVKDFYQKLKVLCPKTIFHGIDVGHFYWNSGKRLVAQLQKDGLEDSPLYQQTLRCIDQGRYFHEHNDYAYRENKMVENFICEYDKLGDQSIMGIFGGMHVGLEDMNPSNGVPSMANQLSKYYGDRVHSESLTYLSGVLLVEPLDIQTLTVNGKPYKASYFGRQFLATILPKYVYRDFWRLDNAYGDFRGNPKNGNVLPYNNYPMEVHLGEVFVIEFSKTDGTLERQWYRSDGMMWNGLPSTEEFILE